MENTKQNQGLKRFIILISFGLITALATGCGQSASFNTATAPAATPTPAPPENYFPAAFAGLKLSNAPKYSIAASKNCACQNFEAVYINGNGKFVGKYQIEIYQSPEEARQGLSAKKYLEVSSEITRQSETEIVAITKINGNATTARLAGANLMIVSGRKDAVVAIENNLPLQALGIAKAPPPRKIEDFLETPVLASAVQKEFETNQAEAAKKYGTNFVLLKGNVADYGDDVETTIVTPTTPAKKTSSSSSRSSFRSFRRTTRAKRVRRSLDTLSNALRSTPTPKAAPTAKKTETHHPFVVLMLPVKSGEPLEIWCSFDPLEASKVMNLKPEQEILFRGKIAFVDGKLEISNARIEDDEYEAAKQ